MNELRKSLESKEKELIEFIEATKEDLNKSLEFDLFLSVTRGGPRGSHHANSETVNVAINVTLCKRLFSLSSSLK